MAELDIRTALTQIEIALLQTIANALQSRLTLATNAALKALPSASRPTTESGGERAYVTATGRVWQWSRYSTATASSSVLVPDDAPTAGRWLLTTSTNPTGYLKAIRLYDGEPSEEKVLVWLFGQVPSVIIEWEGEEYVAKSGGSPGALYWYEPRFSIWAISRNLRGEKQGAIGSAIASEAVADPGVNRIIGDLRRYLAGSDINQTGVAYCEILSSDRVLSSATAERGHVYKLGVKVRATLHNTVADDADNPATALDRIDATLAWAQETGADGAAYPDDYVSAGGGISAAAGLTATIDETTATIAGVAVTAASTSRTFTASRDTYRYIVAGPAWSYVEVASAAPIPATPSGAFLVGVTSTNGSAIVLDSLLAARLINSGITDQIDTT